MLFRVGPLPDEALAAAAHFHAAVLPELLELFKTSPFLFRGGAGCGGCPPEAVQSETSEGEGLGFVLIFHPADHTHHGWRLAAVQSLARQFVPLRINALASVDAKAIGAAESYLATAQGVTGQFLSLDSHGAGKVIASAS